MISQKHISVVIFAILLISSPSLRAQDVSSGPRKPNIVIILADDLGYGDVSCFNPTRGKIKTANIDRLAAQGMRFTDAHSSSSVCSPTRYALLTGRYPWRTRLQKGIVGVWADPLIAADRMTIASLARQYGYATACIGKWHLGWNWPISDKLRASFHGVAGQAKGSGKGDGVATEQQRAAWNDVFTKQIPGGPTTRGFDSYFGTDVPNWPPYCFIENDRTVGLPSELLPKENFRKNLASLQGPALPGWKLTHILDKLADRACDFIAARGKESNPFLLYMPLTAPHTPIVPTDTFHGKSGLGDYGDFVLQTDAVVGRVLDALAKAGLDDNTLVIFTSDNGFASYVGVEALEALGHFPSGLLRGYKFSALEGGHRVPFVVRWPGIVKADTSCKQIVGSVDLLATLADILRVKLPETAGEDSVSLLPLMRGGDQPVRDSLVHQSGAGMLALRQGKWVAIFGPAGGAAKDAESHLYDLDADLAQTTDLARRHPGELNRLTSVMQTLIDNGRSNPGAKQANDVKVVLKKNLK